MDRTTTTNITMTLAELIESLSKYPPETVVPIGFSEPHSYRGHYTEVAFVIKNNTTVGDMLYAARSAMGTTYEGWKGGSFTMNEYSHCYLVENEGKIGEEIGPVLIRYMTSGWVRA